MCSVSLIIIQGPPGLAGRKGTPGDHGADVSNATFNTYTQTHLHSLLVVGTTWKEGFSWR